MSFSTCGVDDGRGRNLCHLLSVTVKGPAADLIASNHVFDEEDTSRESKAQLVKQLQILEQVVITGRRVAVLVVVTIDQQLDDGLCRRSYQTGLFAEGCDERNSTDGFDHILTTDQRMGKEYYES